MIDPFSFGRFVRLLAVPTIGLLVVACAGTGAPTPGSASVRPSGSAPVVSPTASPLGAASAPASSAASPTPDLSQASEAPGGTTKGDIPDNAVFLTYKGGTPAFAIQYVEGWQVTPQAAGVVIRDKDSSETVTVVARQADVAGFVAATDLPSLQAQAGFGLVRHDTVKVGGTSYVHLVFDQQSPPDSVTGKQVPQTVDRYYVPGPAGLAIVSLATPNGVDNVDAFRQMITSFKWS
jgi:hypothetical protein